MKVAMVSCDHDDLNTLHLFKKYFLASLDLFQGNSHVLLSTCNRIEFYFTHQESLNAFHELLAQIPTDDLMLIQPHIHFKRGRDCFVHLCRVAAGLDSMIVCESEILGQIKNSYQKACESMTLNAALHFMFQKAICIGKQVRSNFHFFKGLPNIEHSIVEMAKQTHNHLKFEELSVLILGASAINQKIVKYLKSNKGMKSITVCSHTHEHAERFAKEHDILLGSWDSKHDWQPYHIIISGVNADKDYLFSKKTFLYIWDDKKIVFDLGVPKNIDPVLTHPNLQLIDLEQLDAHVKTQRNIASDILNQVESLVQEKTQYHLENYYQKNNGEIHHHTG